MVLVIEISKSGNILLCIKSYKCMPEPSELYSCISVDGREHEFPGGFFSCFIYIEK